MEEAGVSTQVGMLRLKSYLAPDEHTGQTATENTKGQGRGQHWGGNAEVIFLSVIFAVREKQVSERDGVERKNGRKM